MRRNSLNRINSFTKKGHNNFPLSGNKVTCSMKELQVSIPGSDKWNCLAAEKLQDRMRGLLGRIGLKHGTTMLLAPCSSVHTFGMKFAIDVIFLDKDNRIIKVARNVPKNRIVYGGIRAKKVLEAESGWLPDLPLGIKVAGLQ